MSVKPDPDDAFQQVVVSVGSRHVEELYRTHTTSRAYSNHRQHQNLPWLSTCQLQSAFNGEDSRYHQMPVTRLSDMSWPSGIVRQRFPGDVLRDAAPPALHDETHYAPSTSRSPPPPRGDQDGEYSPPPRCDGASPPVDSSPRWHAAVEDERIRRSQSPPLAPPQLQASTSVNVSDPYRYYTVIGFFCTFAFL